MSPGLVFYPARNPASVPLRRDLPLDPKMLFDHGDALKRMINLFAVSCRIVRPRLQSLDIAPNVRHFRAQRPKVFRRLFTEFLEIFVIPPLYVAFQAIREKLRPSTRPREELTAPGTPSTPISDPPDATKSAAE